MKANYSIYENRGFLFVLPAGLKYDLYCVNSFQNVDSADNYLDSVCESSDICYLKSGIWATEANSRWAAMMNEIDEKYNTAI